MDFHRMILILPFFVFALVASSSQESAPAYKNPKPTVEERAADLLKRMPLEEKVDQLLGGRRRSHAAGRPEEKQIFEDLGKLYREDSQVSPHDAAELRNRAQHFIVEKTR